MITKKRFLKLLADMDACSPGIAHIRAMPEKSLPAIYRKVLQAQAAMRAWHKYGTLYEARDLDLDDFFAWFRSVLASSPGDVFVYSEDQIKFAAAKRILQPVLRELRQTVKL